MHPASQSLGGMSRIHQVTTSDCLVARFPGHLIGCGTGMMEKEGIVLTRIRDVIAAGR